MQHRHVDHDHGRTHFVEAGEGSDILLLHGWPQTWYEWRKVLPLLSGDHRLIVPDLRGLGDSRTVSCDFDKVSVARDLIDLLDHLGIDRLDVVGHDWGGPVAFALACLAPHRIRSLAIVDVVIPGDGRCAGLAQGGKRWHHLFHRTPRLPEVLTKGRERDYLAWFYEEYSERAGAVPDAALDEYVRTYRAGSTMSNGFEYYRSAVTDAEWFSSRIAKDGRLTMPVLGVAGGAGRGRGSETAASLECVASDVTCHVIAGCGHLVPEEAPEELVALLRRFWGRDEVEGAASPTDAIDQEREAPA
ncbi:MAG: alpha/beta hydrolase [Pseudomonadota bacterium]